MDTIWQETFFEVGMCVKILAYPTLWKHPYAHSKHSYQREAGAEGGHILPISPAFFDFTQGLSAVKKNGCLPKGGGF